MTKQIVAGDSLEEQIGNLHKEDIVLDFVGTSPDQLIPDCYYRGSVDGYADFGVFVNIGDHVTGLLHRSEIPGRLESLDWEVGDPVYVQVKQVHDNGNVDLGWSLRMAETEFRGQFVHDPEGTLEPEEVESEAVPAAEVEEETAETQESKAPETESEPAEIETATDVKQVNISNLEDGSGDIVRLEGVITGAHQTSGPTVFSLEDASGRVECAAFDGAGVRAYPEVSAGDFVRLDGEVRERRGELQIETERLVVLSDEAATAVADRMERALTEEAEPEDVEPIAADPAVDSVIESVRSGALAIRRAVIESRPIIVRHEASVDGYLAGAAIEHAVLPLIEAEHTGTDSVYHLFDRRPLSGAYDMDDATNDVTGMLGAQDRHDQKYPLFVFAATGSTRDSLDGHELLRIYDAESIVINGGSSDGAVSETVDTVINPSLAGSESDTSATALATAVAIHVNTEEQIREDLSHLPAASVWEDAPEIYTELAEERGYDPEDTAVLREAVALEAYYQSYDGKRELLEDIVFESAAGLREQVSEQFREKLTEEIRTAEENLDRRSTGGVAFCVLDTDAFTHRFDFPSTDLLLDEIHRRNRDGNFVTVGFDEDAISIRSTRPLDVAAVANSVEDAVPNAGITPHVGHNRIEFVVGERTQVLENTVEAIAETI